MCSGRQSRPHLFHVVRKVCTKSGHVSTIPPVVKNNSHHGISTIKSDYPKKATEKLIENGLLEPEDIPTKEDMEALDRLADRIGIPSLKDVMMN